MSAKQDLTQALKEAMKAKDKVALDSIRAVQSALKMAEIDAKRELEDGEIHALIQKAVKQRRDSMESFSAGGRQDLVDNERRQIEVLSRFLPTQLGEAEIAALVEQAVRETGAASPREMGKVMGWLMPRTKGRADGALVNKLVKAKLGA